MGGKILGTSEKILGYVEYQGDIYPFTDKEDHGYLLSFDGEKYWVGKKQCKEVEEPKESLFTPQSKFEKAVVNVCMEIAGTLIKKNRDYGDSYSKLKEEYGDLSLIIRQSDKLERLKTLQKQGNLVNESTTDTKKDGAGYYILDLAYERVKKEGEQI